MVQSGLESFIDGSGINVPGLSAGRKSKSSLRTAALKNKKGVTGKMARIAEPASSQPIHSAEQSSSQPVEACNPNPTGQRLASTAAEPSCPASQADCALEQSASSIDSDAERKINQKKLDQQSLIESQLKRVYADAQIFCRPFEHQRMLKTAERDIYAITTGKETFADSQSRAHALEQAELRKARAQSELRDNSPKYAQTL